MVGSSIHITAKEAWTKKYYSPFFFQQEPENNFSYNLIGQMKITWHAPSFMIGWRTKLLAMVVVNIRYMIIHWNAVCANAFVSTLILKERGWIVDADAWLCVVDLRTQKHQQAGPRWREVVHCVHKKGKKTGLEAPIQP